MYVEDVILNVEHLFSDLQSYVYFSNSSLVLGGGEWMKIGESMIYSGLNYVIEYYNKSHELPMLHCLDLHLEGLGLFD